MPNLGTVKKAGLLLVSLAICLLALEAVLRLGFEDRFAVPSDERSLSYAYDPELGWLPEPGSERLIHGSRPFWARHNSRGFRDREPGPKQKPRLLVLGDSYVWGFDVEVEERFTERLQERMPDWEILNLGVSGYGTDQALLLLKREIDFYDPDIVFLVFTEQNDRDDNTHSRTYGHYFKPYFSEGETGLELQGTPVPYSFPYLQREHPWMGKSLLVAALVQGWLKFENPRVEVPDQSEALVLAMRDVAHAHGAGFAFGVEGKNPLWPWTDFVHETGIAAVHLNNPHRYPRFGGHWTPAGHEVVAARIYGLLERKRWLATASRY